MIPAGRVQGRPPHPGGARTRSTLVLEDVSTTIHLQH
jgi:hypothetical protein